MVASVVVFARIYEMPCLSCYFAFATTGPILMMWFYPASYRMSLLDRGKSIDYVNRVMVSPDLATITWFVLTVILGAGLGWGLSNILLPLLAKKEIKMHNNLLVLQSDFGLVDGAVSAMIGVALEESPTLKIHHLTHDITPYNIFEGSYRLFQTVDYWPEGQPCFGGRSWCRFQTKERRSQNG